VLTQVLVQRLQSIGVVNLNNTLLVGASGFLGSHLRNLGATASPCRFEDSVEWWQTAHPKVDTVWLVARCCRKQEPRRDIDTMQREVAGIATICQAFPHAHIVYASTKSVYGYYGNDDYAPLSREQIGQYFLNATDFLNDTVNLPLDKQDKQIIPTDYYAQTKLVCEAIIRKQAHTIFRIWDIEE